MKFSDRAKKFNADYRANVDNRPARTLRVFYLRHNNPNKKNYRQPYAVVVGTLNENGAVIVGYSKRSKGFVKSINTYIALGRALKSPFNWSDDQDIADSMRIMYEKMKFVNDKNTSRQLENVRL